MYKKIAAILLIFTMIITLAACGDTGDEAPAYKIGVISGPDSVTVEESVVVKALKAKYGESIVTSGYPMEYENDDAKALTSIANALVNSSGVQAIVFAKSVVGTAAAIKAVKTAHPDLPIICCNTDENVADLSGADLILNPDTEAMGKTAVEEAKRMGATKLYYYSFQRNDGYETVIALRTAVEAACAVNGVNLVYVNSVDPIKSELGPDDGSAKFIEEDASRKASEDKDVKAAYMSTDSSVTDMLIKDSLKYKTVLVPSPYGGFMGGYADALEINTTDKVGNGDYILEQAKTKLADNSGNMSAPSISIPSLLINTAVECAIKKINKAETVFDETTVAAVAGETASPEKFTMTPSSGKCFTFSTTPYIF